LAVYARGVLEGQVDPAKEPPPGDVPLFVYDEEGDLIYSNRGLGRRIELRDRVLIQDQGRVMGSYAARGLQFAEDTANQSFVSSLSVAFWVGIPASLIVAVLFAAYFAMRLSRPASRVAAGLDRITAGDLESTIPETGTAEIARIARSANRMQRELSQEREIRKRWAQDVAHDLRTPIAALKAQFEAMQDGVLDATPERLGRTLGEINRIEDLVTGLEELTRLESPEMQLQREQIPVEALLTEAAEMIRPVALGKEAVVAIEAGLAELDADRGLLSRALSNFLSNAVRHVEQGGSITLFARRQDNAAVLGVHNTGEPIPANEIDRVVERLYRGDQARASVGSGLGLTIARQIAELHDGELKIVSDAGRGTSVALYLPVTRGQTKSSRRAEGGEESP
jgi:two-component system sensor histidine kinase BaeS